MTKKWFQSRTVWSGITKILSGLVLTASQFLSGDINVQVLTAGILAAVWGAYDIIIRYDTDSSIETSETH